MDATIKLCETVSAADMEGTNNVLKMGALVLLFGIATFAKNMAENIAFAHTRDAHFKQGKKDYVRLMVYPVRRLVAV